MNRKWWKFLFLLPVIGCTLYAGGYAAQFIKNYQEWTSAGNFAGNGTYPQAASLHPLVCFHTALTDFSLSGSLWASYFFTHAYGI